MCTILIRKNALAFLMGLVTFHNAHAFTGTIVNWNTFVASNRPGVRPLEASSAQSFPDDEPSISFEHAVRNGWKPDRGHFIGLRRKSSSTKRDMAGGDGAVMPDGGLSPCIIKVVGVGGGGCNAVSMSTEVF
jgi:hypothetical protein